MTPVERACQAYWNAGIAVPRWEDEGEEQRFVVRQRMRAALSALEEPSEAMVRAGVDGVLCFHEQSAEQTALGTWVYMLRAALEEKP